MEAKTIQEQIRIAGRSRLPWRNMELDQMTACCELIDAIAAEFGDARAYDPATHIVVSRECAERALYAMDDAVCDNPDCICQTNRAELRAAMEEK